MSQRPPLTAIARRVARIRAPLSVKLQSAFLLIIAVLVATGLVSLSSIARIERQAVELDTLDKDVSSALGLDHSIVAQEHLSSMFVLTEDQAYHSKLLAEQERFRKILGQLQAHGINPAELARINEAFSRYEQASQATVQAKVAGDHQRAQEIHIAREHVIAHEIEALTRPLVASMQQNRQAGLTRIYREQRQANWIVGGFFLVSIALALALASILAHSIVSPIRQVHATLERIARGEFTSVSDVVNRDELGSLVAHVNRMSQQLADLYAKERRTTQELQEQFESLRRTQAQLIQAEKLRALGEMAGGVAHDFNNLLTIVLGQTEYLLRNHDAPSEAALRRFGAIRQAALDGAHTVRRLLEFTRAAPRPDEVESVDAKELFAALVEVAEPRWKDEAHAQGRQIEVMTDFRDVPPIVGNPAELREVLLNLIFNALDAMPQGGRLTLATWVDGDAVCLSVQDTGVGMPDQVSSRVFEPFFTTKGPQSSGLGLSVSYAIVRRHRGDLSVDSRPGRGATFTMRLPIRPMLLPRPAVTEAPGEPAEPSLRILIVDDEDGVREILRDHLVDSGHQVSQAESGRAALELLERQRPDLVCTDLGMPGMTGWQLADRIKARWPELKVALITGWGARVEQEELAAHRVDFLIAKPFQLKEIRHVLSQVRQPVA